MPVDTNTYIRDVLAPAFERFGRDGTLPSVFTRYGVALETDDERLINARISEVQQLWQRSKQHPKYAALVTALLRDDARASGVLRNRSARVAERRAESARTAERFRELDELIRRVEKRGNPREEDVATLVAYFKGRFDAATVRRRFRENFVRSLAALIAQPLSDQRYADVSTALGVLGEPTYYSFLHVQPGATEAVIRDALARKSVEIRQMRSNERKTASERLVQYAACLTDGRPSSYDRTRYASAATQIATAVQLLAKGPTNSIIADDAAYLTTKTANEHGLSIQEASELVLAVLTDRGIRVEATAEPRSTRTETADDAAAREREAVREQRARDAAVQREAERQRKEQRRREEQSQFEETRRREEQRQREQQGDEEQRQHEAQQRWKQQQAEQRRAPPTEVEEAEKHPTEKHRLTATLISIGTNAALLLLILVAMWTSPVWMRELNYWIGLSTRGIVVLALVVAAIAWHYRPRRLWLWATLVLLVAAGTGAVVYWRGGGLALGGSAQPFAEALIALGVPPAAVQRFGVAADVRRGILLIGDGELNAGNQYLVAAMRRDPDDPAIAFGLGMLDARQGFDSLAIFKYTDATRSTNPRISELALREMAYVHYRRKHFAKAVDAFSQLRARRASGHYDLGYEGCALRELGRAAEALVIFHTQGGFLGNCSKLKTTGPPGPFNSDH